MRSEEKAVPGTLFLIPTPLGDTPLDRVLPEATRRIAAGLSVFIVEHAKTARAFLKQLPTAVPLQQLTLQELNEHTPKQELVASIRGFHSTVGRPPNVLPQPVVPGKR